MARASMNNLIARMRVLINDPIPTGSGLTPIFSDQVIQDVMDEGARTDLQYLYLTPYPTYQGSSIQWLDYYADDYRDFEDDVLLYQYRTTLVIPTFSENIVGHWQFSASTQPPVYLQGKAYDMYRAAADLLERWAAMWMLSYDVVVEGQNLKRSQVAPQLQALAKTYRMKQRISTISTTRGDIAAGQGSGPSLKPRDIDYYSSGQGR